MAREPYVMAQEAMTQLKSAIYLLLEKGPPEGLTNAEIGRLLGIYAGHVGHEGHIPRTLLEIMKLEGVVHQFTEGKRWVLARSALPE